MPCSDSATPLPVSAAASVAVVAVAAILFGCGTSSAQPSANPPTQPTPNYRAIIAKSLKAKDTVTVAGQSPATYFLDRGGIFGPDAKLDHVDVSDSIKMVQTMYNGWAWQTCLRLNLNGKPVTYAVFISEGRVVDARSALAIDSCEKAQYVPLRGAAIR
jgi:hypothetical protein